MPDLMEAPASAGTDVSLPDVSPAPSTTYTVTLLADALRAVLPHVLAPGTLRPHLESVLVEASGALVATDGHTLGAYHGAVTWPEGQAPRGFTLRVVHLPAWKTLLRGTSDTVTVTLDLVAGEHRAVLVSATGSVVTTYDTAAHYPSWRSIPSAWEPAAEAAPRLFNPAYVARFGRVTRKQAATIRMVAGRTPASPVVVLDENAPAFFGILMPVRVQRAAPEVVPARVREPSLAAEVPTKGSKEVTRAA